MFSSVFILGTPIDNYTMKEAVARVEQLLSLGGSHYIVTPNPEILLRAHRDRALRAILNNSSLSLCDGTGSYLAALLMGKRMQARVAGVDFMQALCAHAALHNNTVALVGADQEVRRKTQETLRHAYPNLNVRAVEEAQENYPGADIVFVALGSPKQEQWMAQEKKSGRWKLMVGVGGAFDMISGERKRAPKIMRQMGIEWAWRLILDPRRAGRIASALIVFPSVLLRSILSS